MTTPIESFWEDYRVWNSVAGDLKKSIVRSRAWVLIFVSAGAVCETAAVVVPDTEWRQVIAIAGALLLVITPWIQSKKLSKERVQDWTRARAAAERLKSDTYRYVTGVAPYDGDDRDKALFARKEEIVSRVDDLGIEAAGAKPTNEPMPAAPLDVDGYYQERVLDQMNWYKGRALSYAKRFDIWRRVQNTLTLGAAILGVLASYVEGGKSWGMWVAVLTTVGAAIASHVAAARYEAQAIVYYSTRRRLQDLHARREAGIEGFVDDAAFVSACEDALAFENQSWVAEFGKEGAGGGGAQ